LRSSITGIVVIVSAFAARLSAKAATFATLLALAAVAITNFSSFLLDGINEDLADIGLSRKSFRPLLGLLGALIVQDDIA
jgi:hypothetical protein